MRHSLITLPLSFALSAAIALAATPAAARPDERCTTLPALIRTAAADADPALARRALAKLSLGEKLCEARNKRDAVKYFRAAAKVLGIDQAQAAAATSRTMASAQGQ